MLLNIPIEDLLASQLDICLGQVYGRLSCRLKPNVNSSYTGPSKSPAGISLNLESVCGEDGVYTLTLYASPDESAAALSVPPSLPSTPSDPALFALPDCTSAPGFSHMSDMDAQPFLLAADTSPPSEYFSVSPLAFSSEIQEDFDLGSIYTSNDMTPNIDTHEFSQLMCMAPQSLTFTNVFPVVPSSSSTPGPSRPLSPLPSFSSSAPSPNYPSPDPTSASPSTCASTSGSPPPTTTTFIATLPPTPPPSGTDTSGTTDESVLHVGSGGTSGRRAQYPCEHPQCDRVLTSPYTRQVHMRTHRAKVRKAFLCTLGCGEAFTRQHDRQRHEVSLHGKKCKDVCARCKRFFSSSKMLERHVCRGNRHEAIQWQLGEDGTQIIETPLVMS